MRRWLTGVILLLAAGAAAQTLPEHQASPSNSEIEEYLDQQIRRNGTYSSSCAAGEVAVPSTVSGGKVTAATCTTLFTSASGMVSSFTHVTAGTTNQTTFKLCFATVTATLTNNFPAFVEIEGGVSDNSGPNPSVHWSFFVDGKFYGSQSATVGTGPCGYSGGGIGMNCSMRLQIPKGTLTAASHDFCLTLADGLGQTITWPPAVFQGLTDADLRFGVYESFTSQ